MDKLNKLLEKLGLENLIPLLEKLGGEEGIPNLDDSFKLAELFPKLDKFWDTVSMLTRIFVMVGPLVLLGLGLLYFFAPPKEANHKLGFRTPWGMGSVEAWRFTQRVAGSIFGIAGFVMMLVMAKICNGYKTMDPVDAIQSAGQNLLWQAGIILVLCIVCHIIPIIFYTWKGEFRFSKETYKR